MKTNTVFKLKCLTFSSLVIMIKDVVRFDVRVNYGDLGGLFDSFI